MHEAMDWHIGCSGWSYRHWRDNFYPSGLPSRQWLEYYASQFNTVEINSSFYRLPATQTIERWVDQTPADFRFSVKASRLITHFRQLRNCEKPLQTFVKHIRAFGPKLGPVLFQTPSSLERNDDVLKAFLSLLPDDLTAVFEFRGRSWWTEEVREILAGHGAGFCIFNLGQTTTPVVPTAPDVYVRFHGPSTAYASSYSDETLRRWGDEIDGLGSGRAWVYFNNDIGGHAPKDALRLRAMTKRRELEHASSKS
jgi:uncharacterized protein YecE (DUF72 family)